MPSESAGSNWVRFRFIGVDEQGGDGSGDGDHRPLCKAFMALVVGRSMGNCGRGGASN
jgi:hypothetical protein